ncbi:MAG: class I SAM-dependent methyltransferase [Candidatus Helarchaeota archaeon]
MKNRFKEFLIKIRYFYRIVKKHFVKFTFFFILRKTFFDFIELKNKRDYSLKSGERIVTKNLEKIRKDHIERYNFVKRFLKKHYIIADIGCGIGYGSNILSSYCKSVYSFDKSVESVFYARRHYKAPNIKFESADAINLPVPNEFFDVVISFEVIEHIKDDRKYLKEIKRILKTDGLVVLSTPQKTPFKKGKFHKREYNVQQFKKLISKYFLIEEIRYQKLAINNNIKYFMICIAKKNDLR